MSVSSTELAPAIDREAELRAEVARLRAQNAALWAHNRALCVSDLRLKCLLESENIGVLIGDAGGTITQVNQTFAKMVGYAREDLVGVPDLWQGCVPPEEAPRHREKAELLWQIGACPPWETAFLRPDGSRLPVLTGATLVDEGTCGDVVERTLLMWAIDISERAARKRVARFRSAYALHRGEPARRLAHHRFGRHHHLCQRAHQRDDRL